MEKELLFYLGEDLLDVPQQEQMRFFLDLSVSDLSTLESTRFSASKTITLPGSDTNRKLFGFTELPPADGLDQTTKPIMRVEYDGTAFFYAFVKMSEPIYDAENEITAYRIILLGDNGEWKTDIKERNVTDLDFSEQDHVYNKANIDTSETVDPSRAYVYPLINHGQPQAETGSVYNGNHDVAIEDRTPAWQISPVLSKIFNTIGYKVNSVFFDTGFGSKVYIPFGKEAMTHDDSFAGDGSKHFKAGLVSSITKGAQVNNNTIIFRVPFDKDNVPPQYFDNSSNFNTSTNQYVVSTASKINFHVSLRQNMFTPDTTVKWMTIRFKNNGVTFSEKAYEVPAGTSSIILVHSTGYNNFIAGDKIIVQLENRTAGTGFNEFQILEGASTAFWNTVSNAVVEDATVPISRTLPDMLQTEFLDALKNVFNLYFYADVNSKTIHIEPRDDFYTGAELDWSDKVDQSKPITTAFLGDTLNQTVRYRYSEDPDDKFVEETQKQTDVILASQDYVIANKFAPKGVREISTIFAPTIMGTMPAIGIATSQVPKIWNEYIEDPDVPPWRTEFAHRLLYYAGVTNLNDGEEWTFETIARTDYPYFYSVDNQIQNNNSLYFDDQLKSVGLFNKYFKNTYQVIDEGKLVTMFLHLTETDINNLDYRDTINIEIKGDGMKYTINKIKQYSPLKQGSTEVELLQFFEPPAAPELDATNDLPPDSGNPIPDDRDIKIRHNVPHDNIAITTKGDSTPINTRKTLSYSRGFQPTRDGQVTLGQYGRQSTEYPLIIGSGGGVDDKSMGIVVNDDGVVLGQEGLAGYTLLPAKNLIDSSVAPPTENDGDIYLLDNANGVLAVDSIVWQSGTLVRYASAGADLSGVTAGDTLEVKGSANAVNDGRFVLKTINDGSDFVELENALRTDGTDDEGAAGTMSAVFTDYDFAAQGDWVKYFADDDVWRNVPALKGFTCYNEFRAVDFQYNGTIWAEKRTRLEDHYVMGFDLQHAPATLRTRIGLQSVRNTCRDFLDTFDIIDFVGGGTNDLGISGAGGLDTGVVAASTWYYIYVISSSTDPATFPTNSLASLADETPTTFPTGFDKHRMIGAVVTTGAGTAIEAYFQVVSRFSQHIRRYYWDRDRVTSIFNLSGGKRTVYTSIPFGTLLPDIIKGVGHLTIEYTSSTLSTNRCYFKPIGMAQVLQPHSFTEPAVTGDPLVIPLDIPWNDPNYEYKIDNPADFVELYCTGFTQAI